MLIQEMMPLAVTESGFGMNMPAQSSCPAASRSCADWLASMPMYCTVLIAGTSGVRNLSLATMV